MLNFISYFCCLIESGGWVSSVLLNVFYTNKLWILSQWCVRTANLTWAIYKFFPYNAELSLVIMYVCSQNYCCVSILMQILRDDGPGICAPVVSHITDLNWVLGPGFSLHHLGSKSADQSFHLFVCLLNKMKIKISKNTSYACIRQHTL